MTDVGYGRIRGLGGVPDLLKALTREDGLQRVFRDQDVPIGLLAAADAVVPMRDIVGLQNQSDQPPPSGPV